MFYKPLSMKTLLSFFTLLLFIHPLFSQTNCNSNPEVNFPGGRVIMTFDGNVHDDDDIVAMPMSLGLWWAAGLKNNVVQVEYNNHICNTNVTENDGSGAGSGDDSQNMRNSASGSISRFGFNSSVFYDYENEGNASTNKMASEIEKSTSSNPLWIIAAGPMETLWRGLEKATRGHGNVTIISHSNWNEKHSDCAGDHTWDDLKGKYKSKGVYFVGFCTVASGCNGPDTLGDQNARLSASLNSWNWMKTSGHEYNRYIYTRNPFGSEKFDPSDAGMSYFLISGGPFKNGDKRSTISDFEKLLENPCGSTSKPASTAPVLTIKSPADNQNFAVGSAVTVYLSTSDSNGSVVKHQVYINGNLVDTDGSSYSPYKIASISKGTHTIRVTITDNDGEKTTQSISITAGGTSSTSSISSAGNIAPVVNILNPKNGQNFATGTNISVKLSASDSDGSIAKHQVFVNNTLVDTDGISYSPHTINNVKSGSYTVRAEVTDNKGATAVKTISFTVGGSTSKSVSSLAGSTGTKTGDASETELVTEIEEAAFVNIAPNPVQNKTLHIYQNGHKSIRIVNLSGIVLRKMVVDQQEVTLDIGDFKPGVYILIADQESTKFIVE